MRFALPRKFRPSLLIALSCAGGALLAPLAPAQDNAALIERARRANDRSQFDQVRADLAMVLERSPWNEGALLEQARLLYFERNHGEAWRIVNALLGEYPRNAAALNLRGLLNLEWKKDADAALADFASAVQHNPKLTKAFINRARLLRTLKRPAEALADADVAIALEPENGALLWARGLIHYELKQPRKTLDDFNAAIELIPDDAEMRVRRAILIHSLMAPATRTETFGAMKPDIDRALELVPDHPEALLLRGLYLEFKEDPAGAFDSYFQAYGKLPNDGRVWQALKRTCRSQFEAGRDPARVYQLLDDAKASFVRSDYAPEQGLHLEGVFDFIPFRVSGTDPVRLRNKDYLESLLRDNPGNLRLIYHVHAGVIGLEAEQAMRAIARDYDPAKDKPFAVLAALQVSNILQTRGGSMPAQEQARLYKEAGEWLAKALELDPASDRVKRALAQYNQLTKTFTAERAAEAKANADMATQFENLRQRFVNCRGSIERADATAAGHMEKARAALRGGSANMESLRLSKRWQQMAFDSIKLSMTGVEGLIKDLEAFPSRFPNAPKEAKDWSMEARNYLTNKRADYAAMQTAMK